MTLEKEIKSIPNVYYQNSNLTSENFPKPKTIRTENWKVLTMPKSFSSEEALAEMKKHGCSPMNVWEMVEWVKAGHIEKGKWYVAMDEKDNLWKDSGGDRRVPYVLADSDGGFGFGLGRFGVDWDSDDCLLCFCDKNFDTQNLNEVDSLESLDSFSLHPTNTEIQNAIAVCKKAGLKVYKVTEVEL